MYGPRAVNKIKNLLQCVHLLNFAITMVQSNLLLVMIYIWTFSLQGVLPPESFAYDHLLGVPYLTCLMSPKFSSHFIKCNFNSLNLLMFYINFSLC